MTATSTPYKITWRPSAERDLDRIIDFISADSPSTAAEFGRELYERTLSLAAQPKMGRTGRPGLPGYVREWVVHRNYIAFYRVLQESKTVEILRLKHTAQQVPDDIT